MQDTVHYDGGSGGGGSGGRGGMRTLLLLRTRLVGEGG